ncbi:MAG: hypothetical protein ACXVYC_12900, partial [Blastococcus sp.]
ALLLGDLMLPASIGTLLAQRALETVIGLTIALVATLITHERRTPTSRNPGIGHAALGVGADPGGADGGDACTEATAGR